MLGIGIILTVGILAFALGALLGWGLHWSLGRRKRERLRQQEDLSKQQQSTQHNALREKEKQQHQRIHWLETERDDLELQIKDLAALRKREAQDFKNTIARQQSELEQLRKKQKHLDDRLSLMVSKSEYSRLQLQQNKQARELARTKTQLQEKTQTLAQEEERRAAEKAEFIRQKEELEANIRQLQERLEKQRTQEEPDTAPPAKLQAQYEELEAAYQQLEYEYEQRTKEIESWQQQADNWVERRELERVQQDFAQLRKQLESLDEGEVTVSLQEVKALEAQRNQLREELETTRLALHRYKYGLDVPPARRKDDLKRISGIGAVIEKKLNALGITSFEQIAALEAEDIEKLTKIIRFFPGRIVRDNWVEQAERLTSESD